jgi:hypothetical protein
MSAYDDMGAEVVDRAEAAGFVETCPRCLREACKCPSVEQVPHMQGDETWIGDDGELHWPDSQRRQNSGAATDAAPGSTWRPVDLTTILNGQWQPPEPTVGRRADGRGLLYPGRVHTVAGESEAGKGWLFVAITVAELSAGASVLWVDFEDEPGAVVGRLLAAGATPEQLRDRFGYIRPEGPIGAAGARADVAAALSDLRPTAVLLDGVTEAMGLHGLDPLKNAEVAQFGRLLPRPVAAAGPAVLASDHVTKSGEGRGRYAIGAVHKLNGVDGAAYLIDNRRPFGIGVTGRSTLTLAKDRPGALRQHARPSAGGLAWYADLVVSSHAADFVEWDLTTPPAEPVGPFRPTALMAKVSDALQRAAVPLSGRDIENRVRGKRVTDVRAALAVLVDERWVVVEEGPRRARLHRLARPFTEGA